MRSSKTSNHPKESQNWCRIIKSCKSCFRTFKQLIKRNCPTINVLNLSPFARLIWKRTKNGCFRNCLRSRGKNMSLFWVNIWSRNDRFVTRLNNFWQEGSNLQCKLIVFDDLIILSIRQHLDFDKLFIIMA